MAQPEQSNGPVSLEAAFAGPLFMLSAALLFTVLNLLVKLMGPQYTVWHIGFYRFFGGLVIIMALFGRQGNPYQGHNMRLLVIRGCTGALAFMAMITAIRLLPVSTVLVIFYSFPAFSAVFSCLLYGEHIGKSGVICIASVIIGIGVLMDFKIAGGFFGQAMAVLGGAFAGLTVTFIRVLRVTNGPVVIYLYLCLMGTLVTLPVFCLQPILPATTLEWVMALGIMLSSLCAQLLMNQGFFYCKGWEGGVLMSSEVIFTIVVGIVFLGDPVTSRFGVGSLLIFSSVVTLNRLNAGMRKKGGNKYQA